MRRLCTVFLLAIGLQACSLTEGIPFADALFPPANTLPPSFTPTITSTATRTPRPTVTPTFTATATVVRFPTQDPSLPTATLVPIPFIFGPATYTPFVIENLAIATEIDPGVGFLSVTVSLNKMYWGGCKNNKTTITAEVEDRQEVLSVVIFVRVKSAKKEDYTPWTTGDVLAGHGDGSYSYVLRGSSIYGRNHYRDSWVHFQLVATNADGEEVGRTPIYSESIFLSPCL